MPKARHPGVRGTGPPGASSPLRASHCPDGLRLRSALGRGDLELDPLPLFEAAVTVGLDGREVDEDVPTTVYRDEAVALVRVKPLDGALSHYQQLPNSARAAGPALATRSPFDRGTGQASRKLSLPLTPYQQRPVMTLQRVVRHCVHLRP